MSKNQSSRHLKDREVTGFLSNKWLSGFHQIISHLQPLKAFAMTINFLR
ncbi:hypothetical protein D515_02940 [Grimontia indica]|uniref:Uncharacterized protein n=1 Tax=Grimontia indica TaxID=1056512 RepID=R1GQK5_9GAMM|nr:hypothetical protein D515_02940 [Grimontia indica]